MTNFRVLAFFALVLAPVVADAQTDTPAIAFGGRHAVALRTNGDVVTWGENIGCQLGRRAGNSNATPGLVLRNAKQVAAGSAHTLVLATDGRVYGWGTNPQGVLGIGNEYDACEGPVLVESLADKTIAHIATGIGFSLAVTSDGDLYCTGDNSMAQCPVAKGGRISSFQPVPIPAIAGKVAAVAAGAYHALVVLKDGSLYAFGRGNDGQLGHGRNTTGQTVVPDMTGVTSVSAGIWHSAALRSDGSVWLWGNNLKSQLCDGSTTNRNVPTRVVLPAEMKATHVVAGGHSTFIRATNGTLYACGDNQFGPLGADKPQTVPTPVLIAEGTNAAGLAVGAFGAYSTDGCVVRMSGDNEHGVVNTSNTVSPPTFATRAGLSLCAPRSTTPLATVVNPAPRGGKSGCWTPRVEEDSAASPRFAAQRQAMLAAEALLQKNAAFMAAPTAVRYRTSLSAGPSADGGARIHVKVVPERKIDGTRLWTGDCGVIPQVDRIGGAIFQVSVFFNVDARGPMIGPTGLGPKQTGTVAGHPEYNKWVLITKDGRLPWIPQTLADKLDAEGARRKQRLAEWTRTRAGMKSMDDAAMQKAYDAIKKTDPAGAERMLADLKAQAVELARLQKDVHPRTTAQLEKQVKDYETYRASFTAAQLAEPAVWADPSGEGKRKVDAEIAALQRLSPDAQRDVDTLNREKRAIDARTVRQRHMERVSPLISDLSAQYDLVNIKPGPADRAMGIKPDPAFPDPKQPDQIQLIAISFSEDPDPKQVERRAWQQTVKDTFDYPALASLIR